MSAKRENRVPLTGPEEALLNEAFTDPDYIKMNRIQDYEIGMSKSILRELIERAKFQLGREFGGANAKSNEIGFMPIQPHHVGGSLTWSGNYGSTGWQTSSSGSNNNVMKNTTIPDDTWIGFWAWEDRNELPKVEALQATVGNEQLQIDDIYNVLTDAHHRHILQEPVLLLPKSIYKMDTKVRQIGDSELKPVGWAVTTGANLAKKTYY